MTRSTPSTEQLPSERLLEVAACAEAGRAISERDLAMLGAGCLLLARQLDDERQAHQIAVLDLVAVLDLDAADPELAEMAERVLVGAFARAVPAITGRSLPEVVEQIGRDLADFPDVEQWDGEPTVNLKPHADTVVVDVDTDRSTP